MVTESDKPSIEGAVSTKDSQETSGSRNRIDQTQYTGYFRFTSTQMFKWSYTGIHLASLGFAWPHLESRGLTWIHSDSLGLTWTYLDSRGLTGIH